jgi:hypothetical protein
MRSPREIVWSVAEEWIARDRPCQCGGPSDACDHEIAVARAAAVEALEDAEAAVLFIYEQSKAMPGVAFNDFYKGLHQGHANALSVVRTRLAALGKSEED